MDTSSRTTSIGSVIDIGTNSILLLIAAREADLPGITALHEAVALTRIGRGVDQSARLSADSIDASLRALTGYAQLSAKFGAGYRITVGTSALRDATNASVFTESAARILGHEIEIIDGIREATLTWKGVASALKSLDSESMIVDIGGGSTEFIMGNGHFARSLDIGSVRLSERVRISPTPRATELSAIRALVRDELKALNDMRPRTLVGVAGTVTTLFAIEMGMISYRTETINGGCLSRQQVSLLETRLSKMSLAKRQTLPGLARERADVIVAGAIILNEIMIHFDCSELHVSDRGVRWGLIGEILAK